MSLWIIKKRETKGKGKTTFLLSFNAVRSRAKTGGLQRIYYIWNFAPYVDVFLRLVVELCCTITHNFYYRFSVDETFRLCCAGVHLNHIWKCEIGLVEFHHSFIELFWKYKKNVNRNWQILCRLYLTFVSTRYKVSSLIYYSANEAQSNQTNFWHS